MSQNTTWNNKQDEILIEFVRDHEILFNIKCNDYKNTKLKQNVWRQIGGILNKTDADCSKRWEYLFDSYMKHKGKPNVNSCGDAGRRKLKLLSFLNICSSSERSSCTSIESKTAYVSINGDPQTTKNDETEVKMHNEDNVVLCTDESSARDNTEDELPGNGENKKKANEIKNVDSSDIKKSLGENEDKKKTNTIKNIKLRINKRNDGKNRRIREENGKKNEKFGKNTKFSGNIKVNGKNKTFSVENKEKANDCNNTNLSVSTQVNGNHAGDEIEKTDDSYSTELDSTEPLKINQTPLEEEHSHLLNQISEDETDKFFALMAQLVKKLPCYERAQLRLRICSLITNAEMKQLSSDNDLNQANVC